MSDWKTQLKNEGFKEAYIELTDNFVTLVIGLLRIDRRNASRLKAGVNRLAVKVNSLIPELEEGREIGGVTAEDMRDVMAPLADETIVAFVGIVGEILLSGQDGPMGCAVHLKEAVDDVANRLEAGRL